MEAKKGNNTIKEYSKKGKKKLKKDGKRFTNRQQLKYLQLDRREQKNRRK